MLNGSKSSSYRFMGFAVDVDKRSLSLEGEKIPLGPTAFDLLLVLLERSGDLVTKDELLRSVWPGQIVEEGNLTVHVSAIRKALGQTIDDVYIATVPGRGYQFIADVERDDRGIVIEEHILSRITIEQDSEEEFTDRAGNLSRPLLTSTQKKDKRFTIIAVSALAVLIVAVFSSYWFRGAFLDLWSARAAESTSRQLTASGNVGSAAMSPDGKFFVYREFENGRYSLWYGNTSGGNPIQLQPPGETRYEGLTFTADGSAIFFVSSGNLMKIPVLAGPAELVSADTPTRFSLSADNKQIAFIRRDNELNAASIMIRNLKDGSEHEVLRMSTTTAFSDYPVWSPDGTKLALGIQNNDLQGEYRLSTVNIVDGTVEPLTDRVWESINRIYWLGDGRGIVFNAVGVNSDFKIWKLDYSSRRIHPITTDVSRYGRETVSVSNDGTKLLLVRGEIDASIWTGSPGAPLQQVTSRSSGKLDGTSGLSWTTDDRIVYSSFFDNSYSLWTADADGQSPKQLTSSGFEDKFPSARGDGQYIVFESNRGGGRDIWRVNYDGSGLKQVTSDGKSGVPDISPDGSRILYEREVKGFPTVFMVPVDGGIPIQIIDTPSKFPRISPDGRYFACLYSDQLRSIKYRLAIFPSNGGKPLYQFDPPPGASLNAGLQWSHDGSSILVRDFSGGVWRQELAGVPPQKAPEFPNRSIFYFDWSKNGKRIALSFVRESRDVVLVSNF